MIFAFSWKWDTIFDKVRQQMNYENILHAKANLKNVSQLYSEIRLIWSS